MRAACLRNVSSVLYRELSDLKYCPGKWGTFRTKRALHALIHCPKNNQILSIKAEPVAVGVKAVYKPNIQFYIIQYVASAPTVTDSVFMRDSDYFFSSAYNGHNSYTVY